MDHGCDRRSPVEIRLNHTKGLWNTEAVPYVIGT
jgi:hypothetical protein